MTWADFYLICFAVGFAFSVISFLSGGADWHFHFPHWHGAYLHFGGDAPIGAHTPTIGHAPIAGQAGVHAPVSGAESAGVPGSVYPATGTSISPFNFVTLAAFLAWFGGAGYLLTRYSSVWFLLGLGMALLSGLVGGSIVFLFISKVLTSEEENMDPADYDMVGVLGRTSLPIREGGTGEIIYSQAGTRRTCGARAENGSAIPKGTEVVVTRYDKGIAYVRLWTEMSGEEISVADRAP